VLILQFSGVSVHVDSSLHGGDKWGRVSETVAHLALRARYQALCEGMVAGHRKSVDDVNSVVFSPRTSACTTNDHILAELTNRLDGFAEPFEDRRRNMRFLRFGKRRMILLWVKKLNPRRQYSLVRTDMEDRTDHAALLAEGQIELLPSASILTLGYLLSPDGARVRRVSITPPCKRGRRPQWWIDLTMIPVIGMGIADAQDFRLDVRRSSQQRNIGIG
jgi:hypothetical protein